METQGASCTKGDWLAVGQAAVLVGVHPATLRRMSDAGEGPPHYLIHRRRKYRRCDIETWLAARRAGRRDPA